MASQDDFEEKLVRLITIIFAIEFRRSKNGLFRKVFHEVFSKLPRQASESVDVYET